MPDKFGNTYNDFVLVFSDASLKRNAGLAAVIFESTDSEPLIFSQTSPATVGSNELELEAVFYALEQVARLPTEHPIALFTDNRDAVDRLNRLKTFDAEKDDPLAMMIKDKQLVEIFRNTKICWIKGHASCRGNRIADEHARQAADLYNHGAGESS